MKLHLGCGRRYLVGYTHVDLADLDHIDYRSDISDLSMIAAESVDLIYASHVLEYFDRADVVGVLAEWRRVLKTGGILRLAVLNFEVLSELYLQHKNLSMAIGPIFGHWPIPGTGDVVYHKTIYDYESLKKVLLDAGFTNYRHWNWRKVFVDELKGFDDYSQAYIPHMDKESGILISLNVEAEKD